MALDQDGSEEQCMRHGTKLTDSFISDCLHHSQSHGHRERSCDPEKEDARNSVPQVSLHVNRVLKVSSIRAASCGVLLIGSISVLWENVSRYTIITSSKEAEYPCPVKT